MSPFPQSIHGTTRRRPTCMAARSCPQPSLLQPCHAHQAASRAQIQLSSIGGGSTGLQSLYRVTVYGDVEGRQLPRAGAGRADRGSAGERQRERSASAGCRIIAGRSTGRGAWRGCTTGGTWRGAVGRGADRRDAPLPERRGHAGGRCCRAATAAPPPPFRAHRRRTGSLTPSFPAPRSLRTWTASTANTRGTTAPTGQRSRYTARACAIAPPAAAAAARFCRC